MADPTTTRARPAAVRRARAAVLLLAALGLSGACTDQTKLREAELAQLMAWLPGRYDNTAQVEEQGRSTGHPAQAIALTVRHVFSPRLGRHVLYLQENAADDAQRIMSQRMLSFDVDEKRGIVATLYTFLDKVRWREGLQSPDLFTVVVADDVGQVGCELLWHKDNDRQFSARHDAQMCPEADGVDATLAVLAPGKLTLQSLQFRKQVER
ncbi:MAG: hypothetical protein JSR67_01965 [Proteobacteria bacterium]|nr:hypothetical protein [Pseudomonadota bacterium]